VTDAPFSMKKAAHAFMSNVKSSSLVSVFLERMRVSIADAQIVQASPSLESISLPHDERRGLVLPLSSSSSSSLPFVTTAFASVNGQDDFFKVVCWALVNISTGRRRRKKMKKM